MNSDEQSLIEEDLLFEEDEDNEDEIYLTVEKRYKQRYESEYDKWQNEKTLRQELVKEKLSKKSMPDLVKRVYEYEQRERLSTDALGAQAMVMSGNNFMKMQDCKILDDSVLETVVAGEKKEVAILFDPIQLTINMRKYWTPGGIIWKIRYFFVWLAMRSMFMMDLGILRFNVYFLNATGEYTIDPSKDWTPWELQRKLEAFLQLQGKLLKANIKEKMISGASEQQNLMNAMKWFIILIAVIVIGFLIVMNGGA